MKTKKGKVVFVGAGPGDPDLITVKGARVLREAGLVIIAGSLVNFQLVEGLDARVLDSKDMHLDQIVDAMREAVERGELVARLHTGDTSFYSAISEQIEKLRALGIDYLVIPGVSSAMAGAARLGQELTIPEVSQTVIMTRMEGRTPVPEREALRNLARHQATMVIFLSVGLLEQVVAELRAGGYPDRTPVVVAEKVTWPEERILRGTLADIAGKVAAAGIKKTALIYVGEALAASATDLGKESKLYDRDFRHEYR